MFWYIFIPFLVLGLGTFIFIGLMIYREYKRMIKEQEDEIKKGKKDDGEY